jgi:dihydroorotase
MSGRSDRQDTAPGRLLVEGARVVDPSQGLDAAGHLVCEGGRILACDEGPAPDGLVGDPVERIDARGLVLAPGFWDIHVHFREPGQEDKETVATGSAAAAVGGFTDVVTMPNTTPAVDTAGTVRFILDRATAAGSCTVHPTGAITMGLAGEKMVEYADLIEAGAVGFTDDGRPVEDGGLMRRAMDYSRVLGVPMITHAEDLSLSRNGAMHEGIWSTRLGLRGIPYAAEVSCIARDIELARLTGSHLHVAHVSSRGGVELIRRAKESGLRVTAETAPHFLDLTDADCVDYDTRFKMNPPLRTMDDQQALVEALLDGTLDCIATDHAPHTDTEKNRPFAEAPFGVIGLETSFAVCHDRLVRRGSMALSRLVELMSTAGARIMGLPGGSLAPGGRSDFTLIDPEETWTPQTGDLRSKGRNCPWLGRSLTGRVAATHRGTGFTHRRVA